MLKRSWSDLIHRPPFHSQRRFTLFACMSAFTESGHSDCPILRKSKGCFRPEADVELIMIFRTGCSCRTYSCVFWNRFPIFRMKLTIISMATPNTISANATSHTRICGYIMIDTPKITKTTPGIIIQNLEPGFSIIPLHVSAIGHVGTGTVSAIVFSVYFEDLTRFR